MIEVIVKSSGLKTEDCAVIAQRAGHFKSDINIIKDNKSVNAKSIMGIISLAMRAGDKVYINANGIDEDNAISALKEVIEKF